MARPLPAFGDTIGLGDCFGDPPNGDMAIEVISSFTFLDGEDDISVPFEESVKLGLPLLSVWWSSIWTPFLE